MIELIKKSGIVNKYETQRSKFQYFTIKDLIEYLNKNNRYLDFKNKDEKFDFEMNNRSLGSYVNCLTDFCIKSKLNGNLLYKLLTPYKQVFEFDNYNLDKNYPKSYIKEFQYLSYFN